ncbi:MAG: hypothetical protein RPU73_06160 [Candidatus Sedimenticola sp. (ex Thyasira tokunagai)]
MKKYLIYLVLLALTACGSPSNQPQGMLEEDLRCPEGSLSEFNRWGGIGQNGWAHSCKKSHGKFHVWENGVLTIEGQFFDGKREGKWKIRNKEGSLVKIVVYSNNKEVTVERVKSE